MTDPSSPTGSTAPESAWEHYGKLGFTFMLAGVAGVSLWNAAIHLGPDNVYPRRVVVFWLGGLMGWTLGLLLSPTSRGERARFRIYARAAGSFLAGFVLSKANDLYSAAAKDGGAAQAVPEALLFLATFCLGMLITFVTRSYWRRPPKAAAETAIDNVPPKAP